MSSDLWQEALTRMRSRIDRTAATVRDGFPHYADPRTGEWTLSPAGDWTGGFWVGMLWLGAVATDEDRYRRWAREWAERLRGRANSDTAFRGFLFYYGAAIGDVMLDDPVGREIGLVGARSLATSFNPNARILPLGTEAEEAARVGKGETNVDTVQSSALLLWAHRVTGDENLRDVALQHAARHIEFCLREDGSVCQSASFAPSTGELLRRYTHKGIRDDSTWARAQAWGIVGWTLAYQWSQEAEFLRAAERAADWWLDHVPEDRIAFWDFDDRARPNTNRDTSATAITAASLLKLSHLSGSTRYREAAEATLRALVEGYLERNGVLRDGCYNKRIGLATNHELVWGSYFLFEALNVLAGHLEPARI